MSYDRKSERWRDARRQLLEDVRERNEGTLEGAWPIAEVVRARGPRNQRLLYKLNSQYKAYRAAGDDEDTAAQKLEDMHYRKPPEDFIYLSRQVTDGRLLLAWVKYMSIRGRPASQIAFLLRQGLACHLLAGPRATEKERRFRPSPTGRGSTNWWRSSRP